MNLTMPAAVLWDMDGTLVDTEPLWFAAEREVAASRGLVWDPEVSKSLVGMPLHVYGSMLVERGAGTDAAQVVDELIGRVVAELAAQVTWRPGALELLTDLVERGVPTALVTMSYRVLADLVVAQAPAGAFPVVVTGDDVTNGKPDPEAYLRAAHELGVPIDQCVAIEDSPPGLGSALSSGARTLGVPHIVPVEPRPGLSRAASLTDVGLDDLARMVSGEVLDLTGGR
jgi:HAD superfamily hydrolase (TIGR01509 family)